MIEKWMLEEIAGVTMISAIFFLNEEGKCVENVSILQKK